MRPDYRYPAKPIDKPENISVLIPTRGRPESLQKVFACFRDTVACKDLLDIWLYVDDDDDITQSYIDSQEWLQFGFQINWHIDKCAGSMGEILNKLWQCCTTNSGLYLPFPDDYVITTQNWDIILRNAYTQYDDGIILGYFADPTCRRFSVTFAIPSGQLLNILGYFITNRFYFWYDDAWLDEISQMIDRKVLIPITVQPQGGKGKTARMRNIPFWDYYFVNTLEERYQDACTILGEIYSNNKIELEKAFARARLTAAAIMHKTYYKPTIDNIKKLESALRDTDKDMPAGSISNYLIKEIEAIEDIFQKIKNAINSKNHTDAIDLLDVLNLATVRIPDINYLKACALLELGFQKDALLSIQQESHFQPNEPKVLRLQERLSHNISINQKSFYDNRPVLRMPSWLSGVKAEKIIFPDEIDTELFFIIQKIIIDDQTIKTVIDIGASEGNGSSRAVVTTLGRGNNIKLFCIEPDIEKYELLCSRFSTEVKTFNASSVKLDDYMSENDVIYYYNSILTILNFYTLEHVLTLMSNELGMLNKANSVDCVNSIKKDFAISKFDMAILDGSLFTGKADLDNVYGSRYLVLNHIRSIKNYSNYVRLLSDGAYKLIDYNFHSGCGYAVFFLTQ